MNNHGLGVLRSFLRDTKTNLERLQLAASNGSRKRVRACLSIAACVPERVNLHWYREPGENDKWERELPDEQAQILGGLLGDMDTQCCSLAQGQFPLGEIRRIAGGWISQVDLLARALPTTEAAAMVGR